MSSYYVLANEDRDKFLDASGVWVEGIDDAHQYADFDAVLARHTEFVKQGIWTEICEVPLMHESIYEDINGRLNPLMERLQAAGCILTTHIGEGDETLWQFEFEAAGLTLTIKLESPNAWEVSYGED